MLDLDSNLFEEKIYDNEEKCLVIFSRKTCHVCQDVHPKLDEIEKEYEGKDFGFYHVDEIKLIKSKKKRKQDPIPEELKAYED